MRITFMLISCVVGWFIGFKYNMAEIGAGIGAAAGLCFISIEVLLHRVSGRLIFLSLIGLIFGLIIGNLTFFSLSSLLKGDIFFSYLQLPISLIFAFLGISLALKKGDDLILFFRGNRRKGLIKGGASLKLLDTSVIIDGRISEICELGFIEGTLVVPRFILRELRYIADSSDPLKRNRGRRGLEVLGKIQKMEDIEVCIDETDFPEIREVDSKLLKLGKYLNAKIVTNDYNLNKVAELEGVTVINMNSLAEALKPVVLPGEEIAVQIIKEGKEANQGIGYLDDGTMVVVDDARRRVGRKLNVMVTSILQTSAGRMIFAKIVDDKTQRR
jgi:uncharacterized protein YacL